MPCLKWYTAVQSQILFFLTPQKFLIHLILPHQELFQGHNNLATVFLQVLYPTNNRRMMHIFYSFNTSKSHAINIHF